MTNGAPRRASGQNGRTRRGDSAEWWSFPLRVWVIHWLLVQIPATYALRFGIPNAPASPPYGEMPPPLTGLAHWIVEPLRNWDGLWYRLIALEGNGHRTGHDGLGRGDRVQLVWHREHLIEVPEGGTAPQSSADDSSIAQRSSQ